MGKERIVERKRCLQISQAGAQCENKQNEGTAVEINRAMRLDSKPREIGQAVRADVAANKEGIHPGAVITKKEYIAELALEKEAASYQRGGSEERPIDQSHQVSHPLSQRQNRQAARRTQVQEEQDSRSIHQSAKNVQEPHPFHSPRVRNNLGFES